jgi:hypothetical protein
MIVTFRRRSLWALLGLAWIGSAQAADLPVPPNAVEVVASTPRWSFAIAPYFWAAGISGDVAQFGLPEIEVDADFSDILDTLDFAAMVVAELRYDRFGIFTDLMYVKLSDAAGTPHGILAEEVSVGTSTLAFTAAGQYRIVENPRGSLDLMAGMRVWSNETSVDIRGGILGGVSVEESETWVDPLVGAKGRFDLTDKFYLTGWGMIGGFGVSSDFMWDAMGGVGYEFNDTFSGVLGYRGTGVDFEDDGFVFDVIQHGPIAGLVVRF